MSDALMEIRKLVSQRTGLPVGQIRADSKLLHDLRIGGDDAAELLGDFARHFKVNMEGFPFDQYFPGETSVADALWLFGLRQKSVWTGKKELTISDLLTIAERGTWLTETG